MAKEFKRGSSKDFKGKKAYRPAKDNKYEKKSWNGRSDDNTRPTEDLKRNSDREFKGDKSFETKKPRPDKRDSKPSFERFRDESRPSDFGSSRNRRTSNSNDNYKRPFSEKPTFKKKNEDGYEKPFFKDSGDDKPKSFNKKPFAGKADFKEKRDDGGNEKSFFKKRGDD